MNHSEADPRFEALLEYLKRARGFDFMGYKRSSLMRRIQKRMQAVKVEGYENYLDYLEVHPDEFAQLFNTILINVTGFFRDAAAWEYLSEEIIPRIVSAKEPNEPIRAWSAGCASGEETYTLAMVLGEVLGLDAFRQRVKIYATDVDEEALARARQAAYAPREVEGVPPELREKYFETAGGLHVFHRELRRSIIFGRHDLIQDAPISRVELLVCRNTLMYFNAETQARVLARFHFALNDGGFLFLGKSEMLLTQSHTFIPVDLKRRVFSKVPGVNPRDRVLVTAPAGGAEGNNHPGDEAVRLRETAFNGSPVAQVVVDLKGSLALANEQARVLFGLSPRDRGRPLRDLELFYRPVELRSLIEQVHAERRPVVLSEVPWTAGGETRTLDVQIRPLTESGGEVLGISVIFTDVTEARLLQDELKHSNEELETAYEELQSTNEELQTINDELRLRSDELNQSNLFLDSILASMQRGVVVVDRQLQVLVWNHRAEELWGLRRDEVRHRSLLNLDIGLPVEQLRQPIWDCLAGEAKEGIALPATNRRGKAIRCAVTCSPLVDPGGEIHGAILTMEEQNGA